MNMFGSSQTEAVASPFFHPTTPHVVVASRSRPRGPAAAVASEQRTAAVDIEEDTADVPHTITPEHKSGLIGCSANLMSCIVGSGIVGIPFAVSSAGLGAGIFLIILTALIT